MVLRFRCARPPHTTERNAGGNGTPTATCLASRRRLKARGMRQSGEIPQFREAPKNCAAALTGARHLARTPKSLARNNKTGCGRSGNRISAAECRTSRLNQHYLVEPTMNRDDVLVWLSLTWFVALTGAAIWVLFWPACNIFGP